jgi:para-aminobenzoate synthetase component 1
MLRAERHIRRSAHLRGQLSAALWRLPPVESVDCGSLLVWRLRKHRARQMTSANREVIALGAAHGACAPLVEELRPVPAAEEVFLRLCRLPLCVFFDSSLRDPVLGRYSFVAADPFEYLELPPHGNDALRILAARMENFSAAALPDLPPFQGGAAGLFSYDLGRQLERLPMPAVDEFRVPAMAVGLYDVVVAFDHAEDRAWLISHGWPEREPAQRRHRARRRLDDFRRRLLEQDGQAFAPQVRRDDSSALPREALAPQHSLDGPPGLTSNFAAAGYLHTIERAIEYIRAGDVFQVNLAQRLLYPAGDDSIALYLRLRQRNPATFAAYFDLGPFQIVSASPERFLQVRGGEVEARPIKGTRRRSRWPEADLFAGSELQESEKDRAENVMIVDLLRNDLSRVCTADSVRVTQLCRLEIYEYVQHLVSAVRGRLRPGCSAIDLLRAAFPGGSVTGAPKVRAMEIIAELEPTARGAYCGCLGYLGFDGTLDTSILIRTITAGRGWWQFPVGGGIVAQSVPQREYEETWHKAEGLLQALR